MTLQELDAWHAVEQDTAAFFEDKGHPVLVTDIYNTWQVLTM